MTFRLAAVVLGGLAVLGTSAYAALDRGGDPPADGAAPDADVASEESEPESEPDTAPAQLDFAVLIVDREGALIYRKIGGRRPALDELLAVVDGEAEALRCCPGACVGEPCLSAGAG